MKLSPGLEQTILTTPGVRLGPLPAARGQTEAPSRMGKIERAYGELLQARRHAGEVAWFGYEVIRLRLAHNAWYKPDFLVMLADGRVEHHEVKGFMREAAHVRIKVAAELYPMFTFYIVRRLKGRWEVEAV